MDIGYARTSTLEQVVVFEAHLRDLDDAGCEYIFHERVSSIAESKEPKVAL